MKKINIIILFLILISIVNAINTDQLTQEGKNKAIGAICKSKQGGEACKAYEILKNPTTPLTNELGPGVMKFFSAIKDPMDAGKDEAMNRIMESLQEDNPGLGNAFNFYSVFQKYRGKADQLFGKEEYEPFYNPETNEYGAGKEEDPNYFKFSSGTQISEIEPTNEITGSVTTSKPEELKGVQTENGLSFKCEKGEDKKNKRCVAKGDGFEEIQLDSGEEVIFIEQPKKKLIIKSGIVNFKVNNVDYKEIRDGEFRIDKDGKIEYAKFTAGIDLGGIYGPNTKHNEYKFNYLNKEYKFDVSAGGNVLFDPIQSKIGGDGIKSFQFGDKTKTISGSFTLKFKDINKGDVENIKFRGNGKYMDSENNIIATSPDDFTVCLSKKDTSKTVLKDGCEGTNQVWINKEDYLVSIKTKGKNIINVGLHTKIDTRLKGAETSFFMYPNLDNKFQITKGVAEVTKDHIKAWVESKGDCPLTGKIIGFAFRVFETEGKTCGTYIKIDRTSVNGEITPPLTIVGTEGKSYLIGSTGMISTIDKDGKVIAGAFIGKNYKSADPFLVGKTVIGEPVVNKDTMTRIYIMNYKKYLEGRISEIKGGKLNEYALAAFGISDVQGRNLDARQSMQFIQGDLDLALVQLNNGYPPEDALSYQFDLKTGKKGRKLNIPPIFQESIIEGFNDDGTIKPERFATIAKEDNKNCFNVNEFIMSECVLNDRMLNDIARKTYYEKNGLLKNDKEKPTILGNLINAEKLGSKNIIGERRLPKVTEETPIPDLIASLQNNIAFKRKQGISDTEKTYFIPNTNIGYSINDMEKEIKRLNDIYQSDKDLTTIENVDKELHSTLNKLKVNLPLGTTIPSYIDVIDVATIPIAALKAAKAGKLLTEYDYVINLRAFKNFVKVADDGSELLPFFARADKLPAEELAKYGDIPLVAKVC